MAAANRNPRKKGDTVTLTLDEVATADLADISELVGQENLAETVSFALGLLRKIAVARLNGFRTYIDLKGTQKEELLVLNYHPKSAQALLLREKYKIEEDS